ncbi:T9SS type A sorting domain-containing protein [bacterium SCSIO 12643]|nr:T9SS type A sorting domain-containing protein [bacterium SCSIO 12643]
MGQILSRIIFFLLLISPTLSFSQYLQSTEYLGVFSKSIITLFGLQDAKYDVDMYKVRYHTTDLNGNPVVASGMFAVPINPTCDSLPIALYAHGTVLKRDNVPSANNPESALGKAIASMGYIVAMPDYLGLGDLPGLHPYQHGMSEATTSVDILRAAKEFMQDSLPIDFSNEMFLTGYSQGGHAAMATAKYIQDNQLESELPVAGAAPLSGAYHISKRQTDELLLDIPYDSPGYIVYLLLSFQEVYGNIFTNYSDILQSPYDTSIPPMYDGNQIISNIHAVLPNQVSQYLNPTFLNGFIADSATKNTPMWQALLDNDNHDWTPQFPIKMLYCRGDQTVKPENTLDAYDAMIANGATAVFKEDIGDFDHGDCIIPAMLGAIDYFETLRTDCDSTITLVPECICMPEGINIYPIPTRDVLNVDSWVSHTVHMEIYNINGKLIYSGRVDSNTKISTTNWSTGMYTIIFSSDSYFETKKFTITR